MTRNELKAALKEFRTQGLTSIKLTVKTVAMQEEYDRLTVIEPEVNPTTDNEIETDTSEIVIDEPLTISITYHSFKEILRQRKSSFRPKAHGFKIVKEKRYDQLTNEEWLGDTLAFLDDDVIIWECDYIAA
jgi:hypothetical protein